MARFFRNATAGCIRCEDGRKRKQENKKAAAPIDLCPAALRGPMLSIIDRGAITKRPGVKRAPTPGLRRWGRRELLLSPPLYTHKKKARGRRRADNSVLFFRRWDSEFFPLVHLVFKSSFSYQGRSGRMNKLPNRNKLQKNLWPIPSVFGCRVFECVSIFFSPSKVRVYVFYFIYIFFGVCGPLQYFLIPSHKGCNQFHSAPSRRM